MLITTANLKTQTKSDLAQMAKRLGLASWNSLSKDELVAAILKRKKSANTKASQKSTESTRSTSKGAAPKPGLPKKPRILASAPKPTQSTVSRNGKVPHTASSNGSVLSRPNSSNKSKAINKSGTIKPSTAKSAPAKAAKTAPAKTSTAKTSTAKTSTAKTNTKKPILTKPAAAKSLTGKSLTGKTVLPKQEIAKREATDSKLEVKKPLAKNSEAKKPDNKKPDLKKKPVERKTAKPSVPPTNPEVLQRIRELQVQRDSTKDLSNMMVDAKKEETVEEQKDRIALVVRDAYWLQVTWDITRRAVERARAAMAEHWHHAQPILRLLRLDDSGTTSAAETIERDIFIHGGVRNWYIDLNGTPGRFRVMIGYLSGSRFHMLAKSNIVRTPSPGTTDADDHWSDIAKDAERIFALSGGYDSEQETTELQEVFEDRLKRSMGGPQLAQYGSGAETAYRGRGGFHFDMEVELYAYGSTVPDGFVTLNGEPVKLRSDGTFALRLPFPDRRQVLPAVACSRDGVQQRTVVIAVERNTKVMEPFSKEQDDQP